jgi:hypothetical protein
MRRSVPFFILFADSIPLCAFAPWRETGLPIQTAVLAKAPRRKGRKGKPSTMIELYSLNFAENFPGFKVSKISCAYDPQCWERGICRKNSLTIRDVVTPFSSSSLWNMAKIFFAIDPPAVLRNNQNTIGRSKKWKAKEVYGWSSWM